MGDTVEPLCHSTQQVDIWSQNTVIHWLCASRGFTSCSWYDEIPNYAENGIVKIMRFHYPNDPFEKKKPDEAYKEEFDAAQLSGLSCCLYSAEDFDLGTFKPRPMLSEGEEVLYRGWMLTPPGYAQLHSAVENVGGRMLTSPHQYRYCHYLPEWYSACENVTPKTIFLSRDADFAAALANTNWSAYFVKDYVKSLTTSRGSIAKNIAEISEIASLIEQFRGQVEGGICVRQFENFRADSEERYFVFKQKAFARDGIVPDFVNQIAEKIDSPFFSVDIVLNTDGDARLI